MRKITLLLSLIIFVAIALISYLATTVAQPGPDAPSGNTTVLWGGVWYRTFACPNVDLNCQHRDADKVWLYRFGDDTPFAVSPQFYQPIPSDPYTWEYSISIPSEEAMAGWYRAVPELQLASGPSSVTPNPFIFYFNGGSVPVAKDFCVNYCIQQQ